ncbi:MAG: 30S ribosomal protein S7 [bacterium]|nr:30S ribosomal protein S7 [bacterium]
MARRKRIQKREILPDPKFGSNLVAKFINNMMWSGKKATAERIFYHAIEQIREKAKSDGVEIFRKALENVGPMLEVKSRRVGGATYQVPIEVNPDRREALAMRWILNSSRSRSEKTMAERLASELMAASRGEGNAIKKRDDTHKMAEANRAFAHFRW